MTDKADKNRERQSAPRLRSHTPLHQTESSGWQQKPPCGLSSWLLRLRVLIVRQLRSPSFWFIAALLLALQLLLGSLALPAADNRSIGIVDGGGRYAEEVTGDLLTNDGAYVYVLYEDADALRAAVAAGAVDCGFVLDERIDEAVDSGSDVQTDETADSDNGDVQTDETADSDSGDAQTVDSEIHIPDLANCIDYISSTSSTKGEAAKEDVFACLFARLSPILLSRALDSGAIFTDTSEETKAAVLEEMQAVLKEETLFTVRFEAAASDNVSGTDGAGSAASGEAVRAAATQKSAADDSSAAASVLLFAALLLFAAAKFRRDSATVITYFRRDGFLYQTMEIFAPLLLVGLVSYIALIAARIAGGSRPVLPFFAACALSLLLLLAVLFLASIWAALFSRLFRHEAVYLFLSVALLLLAAVLTPVTVSIPFLSTIHWLRYLLPASWFLAVL